MSAAGQLHGNRLANMQRVAFAIVLTGVSISVEKIAISQKLLPGGAYRLPVFGVHNPGSERTT